MIETCIAPPVRDLGGGFQVRRALPHAKRRSVGPFVFFDQMGPASLGGDRALDVTWMIAGRGIVHSERTPPELRATGSRLFGLQTWIGLPVGHEECEPSFVHHANLPVIEEAGVTLRLILGDLLGLVIEGELAVDGESGRRGRVARARGGQREHGGISSRAARGASRKRRRTGRRAASRRCRARRSSFRFPGMARASRAIPERGPRRRLRAPPPRRAGARGGAP